jgi:hypothetical protein
MNPITTFLVLAGIETTKERGATILTPRSMVYSMNPHLVTGTRESGLA